MKLSNVILGVAAAILLITLGFFAGRLTVAGSGGNSAQSAASPAPRDVPTLDATLPLMDVLGEDIPDLPRFPGATRVEYRQVIVDDLLETEVEYVMSGPLEPVHDFYRRVFDKEGWSVADLGIHQGEWTFFVIDGEREALVELEVRGPMVEVEIELTEPAEVLEGTDVVP